MAATFFFYDLETSGFDARRDRIMQFAGQRTDLDLNHIGEPVNLLVKLTPEVVPSPDAIMVTGITPGATLQDGLTEREFLQELHETVFTPDTTFMGYNTVRFDDEFMRFTLWRNFYDAYEWQWCDGCSRWDLLDVVRLTRALRPDGIEWPFTDDGKPTNRLELLTKLNGLEHGHAHDALSDVHATISLAKLIKDRQPKLFDWLWKLRGKKAIGEFIQANEAFLYACGKFDGQYQKTTAVAVLDIKAQKGEAQVYDLRHDPTEFLDLSPEQLIERWQYTRDPNAPKRLPVKTLKFNRCPALAPTGFLSEPATQERLGLTPDVVNKHKALLQGHWEFQRNLLRAIELKDAARTATFAGAKSEPDCQLYDGGFLSNEDKTTSRAIRSARPEQIDEFAGKLQDSRLQAILPLYKARNFPERLTENERVAYEDYRRKRLLDGGDDSALGKFFKRLGELADDPTLTEDKRFLLEELQLYGQSIMPIPDESGDDSDEAIN